MDITVKNDGQNSEKRIIDYIADRYILPVNIKDLAQKFENDFIKMAWCHVSTFSDHGTVWDIEYHSIDELDEIDKLPNPSMSFILYYVDRTTGDYRFELYASVNEKEIKCLIDKKKLARCNSNE